MKRQIAAAAVVCAMLAPAFPAHAVNRDMVQLQTQVQQLQDAVARLQQSNDERMGVLRDLVQQTADSVNKMTLNMDALQKRVSAQSEASAQKTEQVSVQVQTLADSIDELKARLGRMEKLLQDVQSQQQNMNARIDSAAGSTTAMPAPATTGAPVEVAPPPTKRGGKPSASIQGGSQGSSQNVGSQGISQAQGQSQAPVQQEGPAAPPVKDLYETAYGDFVGGKFNLASAEFNDILHYYPDNPLAGNANFYLGEIAYRAHKYQEAIASYDRVLEQYPGNPKVPVSHLRKAQSLIAMQQPDAGARELRSLVQRFPNSPEAAQARTKLSAMGPSARSR